MQYGRCGAGIMIDGGLHTKIIWCLAERRYAWDDDVLLENKSLG